MRETDCISVFFLNSSGSGGRRRSVPGTMLGTGGADAGMNETVPGFACLVEELGPVPRRSRAVQWLEALPAESEGLVCALALLLA